MAMSLGFVRGVGLAALAGLAGLAGLSGLDRLAEADPAGWLRPPQAFAAQALRADAMAAGQAHDWAALDRASHGLVLASPVEPMASGLLGAARLAKGDAAGAQAAMQVAAQFGWRIDPTQRYWMLQALAGGDYAVAAQRLDGLLRNNPKSAAQAALFAPFESDPTAGAALIARMSLRPNWLADYAATLPKLAPADAVRRAQMLLAMARSGVVLGCDGVAPALDALLTADHGDQALAVGAAHCPRLGGGLLADGNFAAARLDGHATAFDWQLLGNGDASASFDARPRGGQVLNLATRADIASQVIAHLVVISPGAYRISWRSAAPAADMPRWQVSLGCRVDSREWAEPQFDAASGRWFSQVAPSAQCGQHWLTFGVRPAPRHGAGGEPVTLTLEDVALTPTR